MGTWVSTHIQDGLDKSHLCSSIWCNVYVQVYFIIYLFIIIIITFIITMIISIISNDYTYILSIHKHYPINKRRQITYMHFSHLNLSQHSTSQHIVLATQLLVAHLAVFQQLRAPLCRAAIGSLWEPSMGHRVEPHEGRPKMHWSAGRPGLKLLEWGPRR